MYNRVNSDHSILRLKRLRTRIFDGQNINCIKIFNVHPVHYPILSHSLLSSPLLSYLIFPHIILSYSLLPLIVLLFTTSISNEGEERIIIILDQISAEIISYHVLYCTYSHNKKEKLSEKTPPHISQLSLSHKSKEFFLK